MKKEKFFMEFEMIEFSMSDRFEISKKEFKNQLEFLRDKCDATQHEDCPVRECTMRESESRILIRKIYIFRCGCATTYLTNEKCKDGFYFKNKGR